MALAGTWGTVMLVIAAVIISSAVIIPAAVIAAVVAVPAALISAAGIVAAIVKINIAHIMGRYRGVDAVFTTG